jgi:hypothetical protein
MALKKFPNLSILSKVPEAGGHGILLQVMYSASIVVFFTSPLS